MVTYFILSLKKVFDTVLSAHVHVYVFCLGHYKHNNHNILLLHTVMESTFFTKKCCIYAYLYLNSQQTNL